MTGAKRELRRAMVIDDHGPIVEIVVAMLKSAGLEVEPYTNSADAIDVISDRCADFDLVMTDMSMPGFGGLDVLGAVRSAVPDMPVILASGYGDKQMEMSDDAYTWFLQKPWSADNLYALLNKIRSCDSRLAAE